MVEKSVPFGIYCLMSLLAFAGWKLHFARRNNGLGRGWGHVKPHPQFAIKSRTTKMCVGHSERNFALRYWIWSGKSLILHLPIDSTTKKNWGQKFCTIQKLLYLCTAIHTPQGVWAVQEGAFSSAGSEHLPYKQRVGGSNPSTPTTTREKELERRFQALFFRLAAMHATGRSSAGAC